MSSERALERSSFLGVRARRGIRRTDLLGGSSMRALENVAHDVVEQRVFWQR